MQRFELKHVDSRCHHSHLSSISSSQSDTASEISLSRKGWSKSLTQEQRISDLATLNPRLASVENPLITQCRGWNAARSQAG
jgi:hypothetical protein